MEHVVFFPSHDGTPAFRRTANLEDAVRLVEHLRNVEGINEVSCHALTEVPLAFRAYYRVEVPGVEAASAVVPEQPAAVDVPVVEEALQPVAVEAVEETPVEVVPDAVAEVAAEAGQVVETPTVEPEPALASVNGHAGHATDGAKSLGFFA